MTSHILTACNMIVLMVHMELYLRWNRELKRYGVKRG